MKKEAIKFPALLQHRLGACRTFGVDRINCIGCAHDPGLQTRPRAAPVFTPTSPEVHVDATGN